MRYGLGAAPSAIGCGLRCSPTQSNPTTAPTNINGNREQTNNYILDGMDNNQIDNNDVAFAPSVDAIQEFNLISQNAPASFGNADIPPLGEAPGRYVMEN